MRKDKGQPLSSHVSSLEREQIQLEFKQTRAFSIWAFGVVFKSKTEAIQLHEYMYVADFF